MLSAGAEFDLIVLCGGRGVRLRPTTNRVPKALVPIHGKPILDYTLDHFRAEGLHKVTMCVGYKGDKIRQHVTDSWPDMDVSFSDHGENASMLKRLHAVRSTVGERCIVAYGDTFVNLNAARLINSHRERGAMATLVTAKIQSPLGFVEIDDDHNISAFREKPIQDYFVGMFAIDRAALDMANKEQLSMDDGYGLVNLFQTLMLRRELAAYEHDGLEITFNTHDERRRAEKELRNFYTFQHSSGDN